MENPVPLRLSKDAPAERRAGELLDAVRPAEEWPSARRAAVYQAMNARGTRERRHLQIFAAAAAVALVAVGAFALLRTPPSPGAPHAHRAAPAIGVAADTLTAPEASAVAGSHPAAAEPHWNVLRLDDLGTIDSSAALNLEELAFERRLVLARGVVRAQINHQQPGRPLVVVTPHARVVVVGTRFDVRVSGTSTLVEVLEGRVRVETEGGEAFVSGGESIRSDDPRLSAPAAPTAGAPHPTQVAAPLHRPAPTRVQRTARPIQTVAACARISSLDGREGCLTTLARGENLDAQNALFMLGLLARDGLRRPDEALAHWRLYEQRFPAGALAPEASLGIFETLLAEGRADEAVAAAASFEERFADDPRASEVSLARAQVLCARADTRATARALLDRLITRPEPRIRQAAAETLRRCEAADAAPSGAPRTHD